MRRAAIAWSSSGSKATSVAGVSAGASCRGGANESLVLYSMRIDLRDSNAVARQLSRGARSLNRSINLAMAFGTVLRTQVEAERRAGDRAAGDRQ